MPKKLTVLFLLAFLACTTSNETSTDSVESISVISNESFDKARSVIRQWIDEDKTPSVSVAVLKDGEFIWREAFGMSRYDDSIPATPASIYPIASVTKSFTATAIMKLVEQGNIKLDEPISRYFGEDAIRSYFNPERPVEIRDLLQHTSGMGMYYNNVYHREEDIDTLPDPKDRYAVLFYPPGERFEYSNIGYAMLGEIVEKVSGMTYEEYLREHIFSPLEMQHSFVRVNDARTDSYVQLRGAKNELLPWVYTDTKGAGDMYSTAHDLALFGKMHLGGSEQAKILSEKTIDEMRNPDNISARQNDPCVPYGYGWFYEVSDSQITSFWHEGGFDGAASILKVLPSENLVIAVVTNTTFTKSRNDAIVNEILAAIAPSYEKISCNTLEDVTPTALSESTEYKGDWEGKLYTKSDTLGLQMQFTDSGEATLQFEKLQTRFVFTDDTPFPNKTFLNYAQVTKGELSGWILGSMIPTPDWKDIHHIGQLNLYPRDGKLVGHIKVFNSNIIREDLGAAFYVEFEQSTESEKQV